MGFLFTWVQCARRTAIVIPALVARAFEVWNTSLALGHQTMAADTCWKQSLPIEHAITLTTRKIVDANINGPTLLNCLAILRQRKLNDFPNIL